MSSIAHMEFHPLADEFPLMEGEQFEALVENMRQNGQMVAIMLCDGKIIDGRNRYRACIRLGLDPKYEIMEMREPDQWVRWVEAHNLARRHLADGQRAMIAARMAELRGMTTLEAAKAMSVKSRTAQKASVIQRHGSANVIDLAQRGAVTISKAHKVVTGLLPESELEVARKKRGRPIGDHHVVVMRNAIVELERLYDYGDKIVNHWPGDPELNRRLSVASEFLKTILKRTREADYADVGT